MSEAPKTDADVAFKLGELTGTVNTFKKDLYVKLDEMNANINGKIGRDTCEAIVNKAIGKHKEIDHKNETPVIPATLWGSLPLKITVSVFTTVFAIVMAVVTLWLETKGIF